MKNFCIWFAAQIECNQPRPVRRRKAVNGFDNSIHAQTISHCGKLLPTNVHLSMFLVAQVVVQISLKLVILPAITAKLDFPSLWDHLKGFEPSISKLELYWSTGFAAHGTSSFFSPLVLPVLFRDTLPSKRQWGGGLDLTLSTSL